MNIKFSLLLIFAVLLIASGCSKNLDINNQYTQYVSHDKTQCAATEWTCIAGSSQFFDDTGCGCKAIEPKKYIGKSLEECSRIKFACEANRAYFSDEKGCGCEFIFPESQASGGKLKAFDCTEPRPTACTREYMPVCGQVQVECITTPCDPVKETFANKCTACANPMTISYTEGECKDNLAVGTVPAGTASEQCTNAGGTWTGFDCEGLDQNKCQEIEGTFNECASACRNNPNAEVCTLQCVQVCELPR